MAIQYEKKKTYQRGPTFDGIMKYEMEHGRRIHPTVMARFLERNGFKPNTRHQYARNVITVIDRHIYDIIKDSNVEYANERFEDEYDYPTNPYDNIYYHPKDMSQVSMELLRNDDIWYGQDKWNDNDDDEKVDEAVQKTIDKFILEKTK